MAVIGNSAESVKHTHSLLFYYTEHIKFQTDELRRQSAINRKMSKSDFTMNELRECFIRIFAAELVFAADMESRFRRIKNLKQTQTFISAFLRPIEAIPPD